MGWLIVLSATSCGQDVPLVAGYHRISETVTVDARAYQITSACVRSLARACVDNKGGYPTDSVVCNGLPSANTTYSIVVTLTDQYREVDVYQNYVEYTLGFEDSIEGAGGVTNFSLARGATLSWSSHGHTISGTVSC